MMGMLRWIRALLLLGLAAPRFLNSQDPAITSPASGTYAVGQALSFSGESSSGGSSPSWDFGDGSTGSGWYPSHSYAAPGNYRITLTAMLRVAQCQRWGVDANGEAYCQKYGYVQVSRTAAISIQVIRPPALTAFASSSGSIYRGQSVVLSWVCSDAASLELRHDGAVQNVTGLSSLTVSPVAGTSYQLIARNAVGSASAGCSVSVVGPPILSSFTVIPTAITSGESVTLSWSVRDQTQLSLAGIGPVSGSSLTLSPKASLTYELDAANPAGSVSASRDLVVYPAPVIGGFTSSATLITAGERTTLTPNFANGTASISPSLGNVDGPISVAPAQTTTYTLTVTNPLGRQVSTSLTVEVVAPPQIQVFEAGKSPVTVGFGGSLKLGFSGGVATIDGVDGSWSASPVTVAVVPAKTTTYTLRVRNTAGRECSQTAVVATVPLPVIDAFVVAPTRISVGDSASLVAYFREGEARIDPGVGGVNSNAGYPVAPGADTEYVLTVTNPAHDSVNARVKLEVVSVPCIQGFTADRTKLRPGDSAFLTLHFTGGSGVLAPLGMNVSDGQVLKVKPDASTTYTLTVTNTAGRSVAQRLTLSVGLTVRWLRDIIYLGDREVAEQDAQGIRFTQTDPIGSPRILLGSDGNLVAEQKYGPFGELAYRSGSLTTGKGFTGHEQTDPSGLIYMQARFYLPMYGRFASPDPARDQHFEETQSWNIYSYVQNNPVMNIDPTGETITPVGSERQKQEYAKAREYVMNNSPTSRALFKRLEGDKNFEVKLYLNNNGDNIHVGNEVWWDPSIATACEADSSPATGEPVLTGETQSPALTLVHELDHVDGTRTGKAASGADPKYDTKEERRVVTGTEKNTAKELHEGTRTNHKGKDYKVESSTSRIPKQPSPLKIPPPSSKKKEDNLEGRRWN